MKRFKDLSERDRRALRVLAVALGLALLWQLGRTLPASGQAGTETSLETLEQRYLLARQLAARQPAREREARQVARAVAQMEGGLLNSTSQELAQAEVRTAMSGFLERAGIELEGSSFATPETAGLYDAVPLGVEFRCEMDQFVDLLTSLANAETLLAPRKVELRSNGPEASSIRVRLTVEGYLRKSAEDRPDAEAMP